MITAHHITPGGFVTACGRDPYRLAITNDAGETTCKACTKVLARTFVGESRGRKQYKIVCKGGPWGGSDAVFPEQEGGSINQASLSLPIRVGEHVGRYNLNTGHWVPMEQSA